MTSMNAETSVSEDRVLRQKEYRRDLSAYQHLRGLMRPIVLHSGVCGNADGSVLFELGNTKVLVTVKLESGVPGFLRLKKTGWLTAEYVLLPGSTRVRSVRESRSNRVNGRNTEISRFIGRALRSIINLAVILDKTIYIDCDVLQADGGTRSASICAAYCALKIAEKRWRAQGVFSDSALLLQDEIAAVSVGIIEDDVYLDLDAAEDQRACADFNFVLTRTGRVVEIQGAAESTPFEWRLFEEMRAAAIEGAGELFDAYDRLL